MFEHLFNYSPVNDDLEVSKFVWQRSLWIDSGSEYTTLLFNILETVREGFKNIF